MRAVLLHRSIIVGAVIVLLSPSRVRAQQAPASWQLGLSVGTVERERKDYWPEARAWGTSYRLTGETAIKASSSVVVSFASTHFSDVITIPPLLLQPQANRVSQGAAALAAGWDPKSADGSATSLTTYSVAVQARRYRTLDSRNRTAVYGDVGAGVFQFRAPGEQTWRIAPSAGVGFRVRPQPNWGIFAEARYEWLGIDFIGDAKSPRWFATPIAGGVNVSW